MMRKINDQRFQEVEDFALRDSELITMLATQLAVNKRRENIYSKLKAQCIIADGTGDLNGEHHLA